MRKYNFIDVKNLISSVLDGGCSPFSCAVAAILIGRTELRAALLLFAALAGVISHSFDTHAQSKFFSTPSRGGAEGARAQAQMSALHNAVAAQQSSISELKAAMDASFTLIGEVTENITQCGNLGRLFGPEHAQTGGTGCVQSFINQADGGTALTGGLKLGDTSTCNPAAEGTLRYLSSQKSVMVCDGAAWIEVGAAPTTAGAFTPVSDAPISTTVTSNAVGVSGFFGTRTATVTNGASIVVNGLSQGATADIEAGDSIQLRLTSAGAYGTVRSTNFNLSSLSATWTVTTGTVSYGSWGAWGSCSVSCGGGTQTRTRSCNFSGGGTVACSSCGGDCTQTQSCNPQACCTPGPPYVYTSATSYTDACGTSYVNATDGKCWGEGGQVDSSCIINASTWRRDGGWSDDGGEYCRANGAYHGGGTGWTPSPCLKRLRRP